MSYTAEDLVKHADAVIQVIRGLEWIAVDHRDWAASGKPSVEECRAHVRSCQILIVLVAHRYGWVPPIEQGGDGERSIVWLEVEEARTLGLEVLPFLVDEDGSWPVVKIEDRKKPEVRAPLERLKALLNKSLRATFQEDPQSLTAPAQKALLDADSRLTDAKRVRRAPSTPDGVVDDPITHFVRAMEIRYRNIELIGFGEQFQIQLPVDQLYVPLQVALALSFTARKRQAGRFDPAILAKEERFERDIAVSDAFRRAQEFGVRGVALLGDPGAGKTTAAFRLAWQCADALQGPESLGLSPGAVPVVLRLRRLQPSDRSLRDLLDRETRSHFTGTPDLAKRLLQRGSLLWVIDGLDEVSASAMRSRVSGWILDALRDRPQDHFLVTCRYAGYQGDAVLGPAFLALDVQPLSPAQQDEFVGRWFHTVESRIRGISVETDRLAEKRRAELRGVIRGPDFRSQRLASMVANPLFLSILCVVFRQNLDLPRRRAALYAKCTDVLLEHWRRELRRNARVSELDTAAARSVLQSLAWWLHRQEGRTEASTSACVRPVESALREVSTHAGLGASGIEFLERMRDESGLLVSPDPGSFAFLHLTFQEYLAACHVSEESTPEELASHFGEPWWKEVALLALSLASLPFTRAYFEKVLLHRDVVKHADLLALAVHEAMFVPTDVFVSVLRKERRTPARLALVLRLLSNRVTPEVLEATKPLMNHKDPRVADAARELVLRAGFARITKHARPGDAVVDDAASITLVLLPSGSFEMGDKSEFDREAPVHEVSVPEFWFARTPVTNAQYGRFVEARPERKVPAFWTDSRFNRPEQPVVGVSKEDALEYCKWAGMRLPSESEWEYACRAGTRTQYWSGDHESHLARVGWFDENAEGHLHGVGEKPPNAFGLLDMHGNVWEWCADQWTPNYYDRFASDSDGVVRGGSWDDSAVFARSAFRIRRAPSTRSDSVGFRPARSGS